MNEKLKELYYRDDVIIVLDKTRLACTLDKHPSFEKHFQSSPQISGGPVGGRSRFLARCHRFHPGIRARDTCHKTRAEVYKAFRFP